MAAWRGRTLLVLELVVRSYSPYAGDPNRQARIWFKTPTAPGITQEVAPNESQRAPKPLTSEALIYEALFVVRWLQHRFGKGS
jgi:hypothetical protein